MIPGTRLRRFDVKPGVRVATRPFARRTPDLRPKGPTVAVETAPHSALKSCARPVLDVLSDVNLPPAVRAALEAAPRLVVPSTREELYELALGPDGGPIFDVVYDVAGQPVKEADVTRCRNGIAVNFPEDYLRRRDPGCMHIADDLPTDKPRYRDAFGTEFAGVKTETLEWLATQELVVVPFKAGGPTYGYPSLAIVPANAAFFALTLVDLQGWVTFDEIGPFTPRSIIYVA